MKEFFEKYNKLLLVIIIVPLIVVYSWFVFEGGFPAGSGLDKSNWLGFTAGYLSFIGSVFLGMVALWQNENANKINKELQNLQERQLGVNKGILLPSLNDKSSPENRGQFEYINIHEFCLQLKLQNRGNDLIHKLEIVEKKINRLELSQSERELISIEQNDWLIFKFDIRKIASEPQQEYQLDLKLKMNNSCGVEYIENFHVTVRNILDGFYEYTSYNFNIDEKKYNDK